MYIRDNRIDEIASLLLRGEMLHKKENAANEAMRLLDGIEDINITGKQGRTFLIHCCAYDYYDLAKIAIDKGANVNIQDKDGFSPLHVAVKFGNAALVEYLLKNGALPNITNKYGNTPAFDASDNWKILKLLLDYGCDIYCKNLGNVSAYDMVLLRPDIAAQFREYTKLIHH